MENKTSLITQDELLIGFINEKKAKEMLGIKATTLYNLRVKEKVLVFSKIGRKVFYEITSIKNLLVSNQRGGEKSRSI